MRFLLEPEPTLTILEANSTPIVWDDRTRPSYALALLVVFWRWPALHSFLTKRCNMHDLWITRLDHGIFDMLTIRTMEDRTFHTRLVQAVLSSLGSRTCYQAPIQPLTYFPYNPECLKGFAITWSLACVEPFDAVEEVLGRGMLMSSVQKRAAISTETESYSTE